MTPWQTGANCLTAILALQSNYLTEIHAGDQTADGVRLPMTPEDIAGMIDRIPRVMAMTPTWHLEIDSMRPALGLTVAGPLAVQTTVMTHLMMTTTGGQGMEDLEGDLIIVVVHPALAGRLDLAFQAEMATMEVPLMMMAMTLTGETISSPGLAGALRRELEETAPREGEDINIEKMKFITETMPRRS